MGRLFGNTLHVKLLLLLHKLMKCACWQRWIVILFLQKWKIINYCCGITEKKMIRQTYWYANNDKDNLSGYNCPQTEK